MALLKIPSSLSKKYNGTKITVHIDDTKIVASAEMRYKGEKIQVDTDWFYSNERYASTVLKELNQHLASHGVVLKSTKLEPVLNELLAEFYPESEIYKNSPES